MTPEYFIPYRRARASASLDNVLIVGAGSGSDVAIALAQGAKHIDAVEIDPRLQQIGAERHPDHPYQDPRVSVHINDGRAFLEQTDTTYDLILFALPDSLTLVSGQSSLRLESYLFTLQAMEAARDHLKPGGAFAMYNFYREDWLVDRLAGTLQQVYGREPCVDSFGSNGRLAVLTVAPSAETVTCPQDSVWEVTDAAAAASPATDDYPFLYLRTRSIPQLYLITLLLILASSLVLVRVVSGPLRPMAKYVDLFFMGAAFLLLETKSVVQFALLFGTTWFVNALVFAGVLVRCWRRSRWRGAGDRRALSCCTWRCWRRLPWPGWCPSNSCWAWRCCRASCWQWSSGSRPSSSPTWSSRNASATSRSRTWRSAPTCWVPWWEACSSTWPC